MLKITEKTKLGVRVIELKGELVRENSDDFKNGIIRLAEKGGKKVILDMWEVDFIDSVGVGTLLAVAEELEKISRTLVLYRLNSDVKRVLDSIHLCNKLKVANGI